MSNQTTDLFFYFSRICIFVAVTTFYPYAYTLLLQQGNNQYNGAQDTYLREAVPDASAGGYGELHVGFEGSFGPDSRARALIRFDLSTLDENEGWTSQTRISGMRLKLHFIAANGSDFSDVPVNLYRISDANKNWSAGTKETRHLSESQAACWNFR